MVSTTMWSRLLARLRAALRESTAVGHDVGGSVASLARACTCGNPRRTGPCPRHGKLG